MTSVKELMREPSKPKKNFLQENKSFVRRLEQACHKERLMCKSNALNTNPNKYAYVKAKVDTTNKSTRVSSCSSSVTSDVAKLKRPPSLKSVATCDEAVQCNDLSILAACCSQRHQSTQTLNDLDQGYGEGKIVTPSARPWRSMDRLHFGAHFEDDGVHSNRSRVSQVEIEHTPEAPCNEKVIVPVSNKDKPCEDPLRAPSSYQRGVVPRYLKERQEEQTREAQRALLAAPDPDCPPGHRRLSETERLEHLTKLRTAQDKLLYHLNRLPSHLDTLRSQRQRRELDCELDRIEKLIVAFSKAKVFVELDPQ